MNWPDGLIAVDWGTTNRRAYRLDSSGKIAAQFEDDLGVTAVPLGGFDAAVGEIRARLGDLPLLMAGMIGSNRGWHEVPYVPCPADVSTIARSVFWIAGAKTGIVPGVSQHGAAGADVMRGEEVQILGAIANGLAPADGLACHPGTHAKWVVTTQSQISAFRTMMTGEIFSLLRRHSILADRIGGSVECNHAFAQGVDEAFTGGEMLACLFRLRARHLLGESDGDEASYASGLLIGCDVRAGLMLGDARTVTLIGRPDLCTLYAAAIAMAGRDTIVVDGPTAFLAGIRALRELL